MSRRPRGTLDEDLRDHIERETQDNIDRGMSPGDARHAAIRKFGNVTRIREDVRAVWIPVWLGQPTPIFRGRAAVLLSCDVRGVRQGQMP
jgi:hypothetical protein